MGTEMKKLIELNAVAAPIPADNLDTDQLMPKQFLRGIDKSGLAAGLLYNMRFDANGERNAGFVLNKPGFEETAILCGGPNFGCGSSREHAVWGLLQYGIRAVIAPGFGEIFYSNAFNNGLLAAKVTPEASREIFETLSEEKPVRLIVSVEKRTISTEDGSRVWPFEIAERHRTMLLEGFDMLEATLRDRAAIEAFRAEHERAYPWMAGLAGKRRRLRDQGKA